MRAGREDGCGQVYDQEANPLLYQDEYIVIQDKAFVASNCPDAPYPLTEANCYLTNWRFLAIGDPQAHVDVQTTQSHGYSHYAVVGQTDCACDYLEVYLDEVREVKKTLLGELKLRMQVGTVDITELPKAFRKELQKALEWYLTPKR
jgi:hypothetical protein